MWGKEQNSSLRISLALLASLELSACSPPELNPETVPPPQQTEVPFPNLPYLTEVSGKRIFVFDIFHDGKNHTMKDSASGEEWVFKQEPETVTIRISRGPHIPFKQSVDGNRPLVYLLDMEDPILSNLSREITERIVDRLWSRSGSIFDDVHNKALILPKEISADEHYVHLAFPNTFPDNSYWFLHMRAELFDDPEDKEKDGRFLGIALHFTNK